MPKVMFYHFETEMNYQNMSLNNESYTYSTVYGPIPGKAYVNVFSPCSQFSDSLAPVQM